MKRSKMINGLMGRRVGLLHRVNGLFGMVFCTERGISLRSFEDEAKNLCFCTIDERPMKQKQAHS